MKKDLFNNKKTKATDKKKYSSIQYFFWLLSGCEINILKDCPTDYNRQAGIGFTIFMTTVLAFCSGGYAGWYFGEESMVTAIIFGLLWSALIFSIDRSMVVTLKKDPTKKKQSFWAPLLSRGIMALLIAFIISIPLELLIFRDSIDIYKPDFIRDKTLNTIFNEEAIENIDGQKETRVYIEKNITSIKNEILKPEPTGDIKYDQIKANYLRLQAQYNTLDRAFRKAKNYENNAFNRIPKIIGSEQKDTNSSEWRAYKNSQNKTIIAKRELNNFDKASLEKAIKDKEDYITNWKKINKDKLNGLQKDKTQNDENIKISTLKIDNSKKVIDSIIEKHNNSFVFNFMVLEKLATSQKKVLKQVKVKDSIKKEWDYEYDQEGATILFLLWLIRILFFTIEILPTIAKIATPLGAYDYAIYRKEREIEEDLVNRTQDNLKHQKAIRELENSAHHEQIISKNKIENELHVDLLKEIASAQNDVAKKQIEYFRKKHLESS